MYSIVTPRDDGRPSLLTVQYVHKLEIEHHSEVNMLVERLISLAQIRKRTTSTTCFTARAGTSLKVGLSLIERSIPSQNQA